MENNHDSANSIDDLEHLKKLHDEGTLSEEEFAAAKARLLGISISKETNPVSSPDTTLAQKQARRNFAIGIVLFVLFLIILEINANSESSSSNSDIDRFIKAQESHNAEQLVPHSATSKSTNPSTTNDDGNASSTRFDQELEEWTKLRNTTSNKSNLRVTDWHLKCKYKYSFEDEAHCVLRSDDLLESSLAAGLGNGHVVLMNHTDKIHGGDILIVSGKFGGVTEGGDVIIYVTKIKNEGVQ